MLPKAEGQFRMAPTDVLPPNKSAGLSARYKFRFIEHLTVNIELMTVHRAHDSLLTLCHVAIWDMATVLDIA